MSDETESHNSMDAVIIEKEDVILNTDELVDEKPASDVRLSRKDSFADVLVDSDSNNTDADADAVDEKDRGDEGIEDEIQQSLEKEEATAAATLEDEGSPRAVQIVSIGTEEDAYAFTFHEDKLNQILCKVPEDDLVAVVSVVGAFRTGKSFLLNWFLRYLHIDESATDDKWYEKLSKIGGGPSSDDQASLGFDWRGGSERNTTGIWMWSKPFQRTRPDGSTISVLLVDTQGMFDHETTMALTAAIFGLSTLLSSYQIYNVDKRIQEDNLQQLALFSEYGKMALEQNQKASRSDSDSDKDNDVIQEYSRPPFQKIEFLVRDWQNYEDEDDEKLMDKEMKEYLESVLRERDAKDLQETRQHINESFEQVSCFMLTHPGFAVTKKKYEGNISAIDSTFLTLLSKYCRKVFDGKDLEPKQIHGRFLTASELGAFIKAYALLFKSGASFPEAGTMLEATAAANNTVAIDTTMTKYVKEMDQYVGPDISAFRKEDDLYEFHDRVLSKCMKEFNHIATFGSMKAIEIARNKVVEDITQRFYLYEKLNQGRNPLAGFETFIVPSGIAVVSYILRSIADMTCTSWSQTCRAGSDALSHILAVAFIFLCIVYATKAKHVNTKVQQIFSALHSVIDAGRTTQTSNKSKIE